MTSQSPRIYIYKITFEGVLYYYYGVHKEKKFDEYYMGSPVTHKWMWDFYTPKKQILQLFDFTNEGWLEAQEVEKRIIKPVYNIDNWCLNESCGCIVSIEICRKAGKIGGKISGKRIKKRGVGIHGRTKEQMSEDGKKAGKKTYELGIGVHGRTKEQMSEDGKKAGKIGGKIGGNKNVETGHIQKLGKEWGNKCKEEKIGVCGRSKEKMSEDGKKGGAISYEMGVGVHGISKEKRQEYGKKGGSVSGKITYELGLGIHALTTDQRKEIVAKTNSQRWMCEETGYVSTPAGLTSYQRARSIDTSKRKRIS
tara:strand:+ start:43 stop:969 length:927 start_codon:yes stop_codon:yes gene_type:complete